MVLQNYQNLKEMTSNIFHIVAFGVGFKCPRNIHLNTQCRGGQVWTFCRPPPPLLVHVVVECPLNFYVWYLQLYIYPKPFEISMVMEIETRCVRIYNIEVDTESILPWMKFEVKSRYLTRLLLENKCIDINCNWLWAKDTYSRFLWCFNRKSGNAT